jgi:hypothetical protein
VKCVSGRIEVLFLLVGYCWSTLRSSHSAPCANPFQGFACDGGIVYASSHAVRMLFAVIARQTSTRRAAAPPHSRRRRRRLRSAIARTEFSMPRIGGHEKPSHPKFFRNAGISQYRTHLR